MASANLDLVRSIFGAWERGSYGSVDWADPEIEFVRVDGPDPMTRRGIDEMGRAWRAFLAAWDDYSVYAEEYREIDDERVLVLVHMSGRGRTSGIELAEADANGANLFEIRDGRVTRLCAYFKRERAFADLGLEPEASGA
jgi:ketosteroid isomerase-like protein